jgi:diguanylate cyclase (GGDEF)-like protein
MAHPFQMLPVGGGHRRGTRVDNGGKFLAAYSWAVIVLAVAILVALTVTGQLYWSVALTFLSVACVLSEWRVVRLPQGDSLTLSIIFVLLALVLNVGGPTTPFRQAIGAVQVMTIGALVGYGLTHRPSLLRLGFYVGHQVISTTVAGATFVLASRHLPYWLLESLHVPAVALYVLVLSITSMLLIGPVSKRILHEEKLPRTDILYAVFLAPIALIVFYFSDTRQLDVTSLLVLALPLIGVLVTFTLYVNIDTTYGEINQLYRISREFVAAMSQEQTILRISESIARALRELISRVDVCLVYSRNAEANEYVLANVEGSGPAPQIVLPGHGLLGRAVLNATGTLVRDIARENGLTNEELQWQPKTAVLAHPMFAEQHNVGLLVLIRKGAAFAAEEFRLVSIVANQAGGTLHNAQLFEQSRQLADVDRQLGIFNQAAFIQRSQQILSSAQLSEEEVAVLLGDIDDFRVFNNTYGHDVGDQVLSGVSGLMRESVGESGIVGRWGGEEFVATLPRTSEQGALAIADEIQQRVRDHAFHTDDGSEVQATISIGVALFPRDAGDFASLHKQADRAAYLAKKTGKDRVCLYEDRKEILERAQKEPAPAASSGVEE